MARRVIDPVVGRAARDRIRKRPARGGPARGRSSRPVSSRSIGSLLRVLRGAAKNWNAPVTALMAREQRDPFMTLIGCVLSLRTKDEVTAQATRRLFALARTPAEMLRLAPARLQRAIYPVGFYRVKTQAIRRICADLIGKFGGRVPDQIDQLLTLDGVGRKTANLVVTEAYGKPGICVDTHVHRISNRWGLVRTSDPGATEQALREGLPRRYWLEYNGLLVAFGQTICQPVSPWCSRCPIAARCPRIGVERSR